MKLRFRLGLMALCLCTAAAMPQSAPADLGAAWVRLDDAARLELLVDALRHDMALSEPLRNQLTAPTAEPEIAGDAARMRLPGGGIMTFVREGGAWRVATLPSLRAIAVDERSGAGSIVLADGLRAGQSFVPVPVFADAGLERLTRGAAEVHLERELFGAPGATAAFYEAEYRDEAPFVRSRYVQFVADPAWNRLLYGSLGHWIKSVDDLRGVTDLAVDAEGRLFVAEAGRSQIRVFELSGVGEAAELAGSGVLTGIGQPAAIAHDDRGTPLATADDRLWIADGAANRLRAVELATGQVATGLDGLDNPVALRMARRDGAASGDLFMIDEGGRRLRLLTPEGGVLHERAVHRTGPGALLASLTVDHFGNAYVVERMRSRVLKFAPDLTLLAESGSTGEFEGLAGLEVPFGRISIAGEGTVWSGFDQLFAIERWSEGSGVQRRRIGLSLENVTLRSDQVGAVLSSEMTATDAARLDLVIRDAAGATIRTVAGGWRQAGHSTLRWDRRDDDGRPVRHGAYRLELRATGAYADEPVTVAVDLELPDVIWQNCGGDADGFRVQGVGWRWGDIASESAATHSDRVAYRFRDLRRDGDYRLQIECAAPDNVLRRGIVMVDGRDLGDPVVTAGGHSRSAELTVPGDLLADGRLQVEIVNAGGPDVSVSQIWLYERGRGIVATPAAPVADGFALEQNYPNPFNPETRIAFRLPEDADVRLEIYTVLGQRIRSLTAGYRQAGTHEIVWNGRDDAGRQVASGMYLYRLQAGEHSAVRRMLLLR